MSVGMNRGMELESLIAQSGKRAEGKVEVAGAGRRTETKGCES